MGLTVSLGLERFWLDGEEEEGLIRSILDTGSVDKLRVVLAANNQASGVKEFVITEGVVTARVLPEEESRTILDDIEALTATHGGRSASFSWDEAESLAYDIQDLAVVFTQETDPMELHRLQVGSDAVRMISIQRSKKLNWTTNSKRCDLARAIHDLAERHHLIVHSA